MTRKDVLNAIVGERLEQIDKWGLQRSPATPWMTILMEELGEAAKAQLEGDITGAHGLRRELVQCAAVIVAWLENLD